VVRNGWLDSGKVEYNWEYSTSADILTIIRTEEGKEPIRELFGQMEAIAQMETLIDWFVTYEGMGALEKMVTKIKESKNE
jgi:hypothetical protein